jgi:hypothetical protein
MIAGNGWHMKEQVSPITVTIPKDITMEGYNDERCMVVLGPGQDVIKGGTFWLPINPADPTSTARSVYSSQTNCDAVGFSP